MFMDEKVYYTKVLGIKLPWFVKQVMMDEANQRIDIYVDHEKDIRVRCPECGEFYRMYDHGPERVYKEANAKGVGQGVAVRRNECPHRPEYAINDGLGKHKHLST